jgi:allantoinase
MPFVESVLVVRSNRIVLPEGERSAALHISGGVIERIVEYASEDPTGARVFNVPDLVISPGLVDTHVHINEPGRTEWEGFDTATRAAACGGVTTLVDMPLNSVPATTCVAGLHAKVGAARAQCHVDVGFWGGVVPGNAAELDPLIDAGVRGFKCFLVPSGVDEFPPVTEDDLRRALPILARRNMPLLVHAELAAVSAPQPATRMPHYASYLASRPAGMELDAIRLLIRLAEEFRTRIHVVHVSSAEGAAAIAGAKAAWVPITAETCPHYLTFAAGRIPDSAQFKCAPPIREHRIAGAVGATGERGAGFDRHRSRPLARSRPGVCDCMGRDRVDGTVAPPSGPRREAVARGVPTSDAGVCSARPARSLRWACGCRPARAARGLAAPALPAAAQTAARVDLARWMSSAPAALAGLGHRKGRIAEGLDADLVVWDPDLEFCVESSRLQQRHKLTPYAGRWLFGTVLTTFVRGERVWDKNRLTRAYGGQLL